MIAGPGLPHAHIVLHGNGVHAVPARPPRPAELNHWAMLPNDVADRFISMSVMFSGIVAFDAIRFRCHNNLSIKNPLSLITGALLLASTVALIKNGMNLQQLKADMIKGLKEYAPYIISVMLTWLICSVVSSRNC